MAAHVQQPAPDFKAQAVANGTFKTVSLSDYKGKYLVLFFYPLDFTFVCPTEILAYNDRQEEFRKLGAEVVGASVDSEYTHLAWINTDRKEGGISGVTIPLLADLNKKIASDYGVLLPDGVALRGTFVIDPKGILRTITIPDLPVGRSVDEAIRQVQAIKFADEHGEVCPANWEPGKDSMKADPKATKEYFKKVG
jgi:peroxiredoxin (alkyl hydroperoxide reductase subunit C)